MRRDQEKIPTGVPGLDNVLIGGVARGGFYLVQGDPGSGKTTLALQYVRERLEAGERCLYVCLTESPTDLEDTCRSHGWSLGGVDLCDLTRSSGNLTVEAEASVFHPGDTELGDIIKAVMTAVEKSKPAHVIFDGLAELRLLSGDALRYRRQLLSLKEFFARARITVLLLDDRSSQLPEVPPESLVGGNIVFERHLPPYGRARRRMFVTKMRGANFREGYHDYEIVTGGVVIHPRLVAAEHHVNFSNQLHPSGVVNLDAMLGGGLTAGTTTLMQGPAGCGKSTIAMQFAINALGAGHKAAAYVFDEIISILIARVQNLCLDAGDLQKFIAERRLHLQQIDPAEMSPGAFAREVRRSVDDGAKVIIIDSLNGYLNAMPDETSLSAHLHELFAYLNQNGVVTILVTAQHGMVMGTGNTDIDVSYLSDTVLLFRYFEARGEIRQALGVFKKRTGAHERTLRELRVDAQGIRIGEPLREFIGVMTGVPRYEGQTIMLPSRAPATDQD